MDVTEDANAYRVKAEIPGVKKEDIHVSVEGNTVSISAECERKDETRKDETLLCSELYRGKAARSFTVMTDVDEAKAEAKYENGILELTLPKKAGARNQGAGSQVVRRCRQHASQPWSQTLAAGMSGRGNA